MQWQGGLCCKMSFMQRKPYLAMHVCASCSIEKSLWKQWLCTWRWKHIFNIVLSSYNQSDPWLICIRSDIIEGLKCFIQASVGSIPFVKIITAYSLNCSLQNADMHGHELFMAMDENRDWKLNFSQTDNVSKPCSQDWMSLWFNDWTYNWMFGHSLVQSFSCSDVQLFSCSTVQLFRCSDVQLNTGSDVQAFSCSGVQLFRRSDVQTDERFINRTNDNSSSQSYEWTIVQMTAHELLLAMDDNLNQNINFFANGYVSLTNAHQANYASKSNAWRE